MKVYYDLQDAKRKVSADNPVEMSLEEARHVLNSLHGTGSFFGLEISTDNMLQFYSESGVIWTEVLDVSQLLAVGCEASLPIAELALEAAYEGKDIQKALSEAGFDWLDWRQEIIG